MTFLAIVAAAALAAHPEHVPTTPGAPRSTAAVAFSAEVEAAAVRAVLSSYKAAIEKLDATGTERLFTADSRVFETGGVEGSYSEYLGHHLEPELKEFKTFRFSDYKVDVRFEGPVAVATESYKYRIEPKSGEVAERLGVATSVLRKENGQWKIVMMHNSARKTRPAS